MSVYSNVTEQGLNNLHRLAEQPKTQRALKIEKKILKETHDIKKAESLSPITNKLDESNKKMSEVIKESNSVDDNQSKLNIIFQNLVQQCEKGLDD